MLNFQITFQSRTLRRLDARDHDDQNSRMGIARKTVVREAAPLPCLIESIQREKERERERERDGFGRREDLMQWGDLDIVSKKNIALKLHKKMQDESAKTIQVVQTLLSAFSEP